MAGSVRVGTHELVANDSSAGAKVANKERIQAATAYAYNNGIKETKLGPGTFWFDQELSLGVGGPDQKSLHLKGSGGGAWEPQTTNLRFSGVTTVGLNVGNGQFMQLSDLTLVGDPSPSSRA